MTSKIEQQVMASVGIIYGARQLLSAPALKLYTCVVALLVLARLVWVSRVFENLSQVGFQGALNFWLNAIVHTNLGVQLALVVMVVAGVSLLRDLARPVFAPRLAL